MKSNTQQKLDLDCRINRARLAGACKNFTLAEFKDYLLILGLNKYEKTMLPVETENNCQGGHETTPEAAAVHGKIIPFPGVSLSDHFQNDIDNFLMTMGYIE